ncbi:MAG TPA: hypothetical protein DIT13_00240 [Verrucomicrobiales bacterium]|nr:hypothetical protein [Verrucomicrobiales bacterium]
MVVVAVLLGGFIVLHSDPHATNISRPTLPQTTKPTSIAPSWSQPGEVESKLLERAHAEIDHVYKTVMDTLIPAQQESLRQEEREWISWRDAEADRIARRTSVGGSAYRVDRLNAMIDLVKKSGRSICAAIVPSQPFERRNWAISNHLLELPFERRFWTQSELPQRAIWDSLWCFR